MSASPVKGILESGRSGGLEVLREQVPQMSDHPIAYKSEIHANLVHQNKFIF